MTKKTMTLQLSQGKTATVIAIKGDARLQVITNGKALVSSSENTQKREKSTLLAETEYGVLKVSPKGKLTTAKITLPTSKVCSEELMNQMELLVNKFYGKAR